MSEVQDKFNAWAIIELYGHQQIAGEVSEQEIAGAAFVRVDVPGTEKQPAFTRFYGAGAIYSITPVSQEVAELAAKRLTKRPVTVYIPEIELHRQLTGPGVGHADDGWAWPEPPRGSGPYPGEEDEEGIAF